MSDLLVYNARVRTLEAEQPSAQAVLVRNERIVAVGENEDLLARAAGARKLDARGRTVLPGFIDSHVHFWRSGLAEQMVDLRGARSILEVLDLIRRRAAEQPAGSMIMARGFIDTKMAENRWPTLAEKDEAAGDHLLCICHNNGHGLGVNSKFLDILRIPIGTPGLEVDPSTGQPTGTIREKIRITGEEKAMSMLDPAMMRNCLKIISDIAIRAGVTTVHCLDGGRVAGDADMVDLLAHRDELPLNTVIYYQITDVEKIVGMGLPRIGGCLLVDGTPATHTGALFEPYSDWPDLVGPTYWQQEELDEFVWRAHSAGLQVSLHATCERAIDLVLTAYERAIARLPRPNHRHRIEHFYFPRKEDVERAARLGVCAGVQPAFETAFREMYPLRLGPERMRRVHPYRWHLDAGVVAGGGSDSPVSPIDPIAGIHAAVNHSVQEQRITPKEAVRMFTISGAYLAFEEREAGTIREGKRGDLVVLSDDPIAVDPTAIKDIKVEATVVRGRVVYEA